MKLTILLFVMSFINYSFAASKVQLDTPSKTLITDLKPHTETPTLRRSVTCYIYPSGAVKVLDESEKGAARLSIFPHPLPRKFSCSEEIEKGEVVLKDWNGYFFGIRNDHAIFQADDASVRGGIPFMVVRMKDQVTVFIDEASMTMFELVEKIPAGLKLKYNRILSIGCSVAVEEKKCINKIAKKGSFSARLSQICKKSYEKHIASQTKFICAQQFPKDSECFKNQLPHIAENENSSPTVINYRFEKIILNKAVPWKNDINDQQNIEVNQLVDCYPAQ